MDDTAKQARVSAGDILALEKSDSRRAEALWQGLSREQRLRLVLSAPAEQRERLITLAADAEELTRALAPDEFASTVLALGPGDAETMIALCDDDQLTYLLDLTGWVKDDFAPSRYETWLPLIMEAGADRLERWLASTDLEVLTLLCAHWFQVVKYVPSQDEQEPPDDLPSFTLDGIYHLEFKDGETAEFVAQVLVVLRSELEDRYYQVMEAMLWESTVLMAEDSSRFRRGRLMDHGFPPRDEALELWAKPRPGEDDWSQFPRKADLGFHAQAMPRSDALIGLLAPEEPLPALVSLLDRAAGDALRAELAYVANCAVSALEADPAEPAAVARAAQDGLSLVNLGLAVLTRQDPTLAGAILERLPLTALARQGAQTLRELNRRAWALLREGWLKDMPGGLLFLDPPLDRALAGLCFSRPRCYDASLGADKEFRAFQGLADLAQAERYLAQAEFWGRLLLEYLGLAKEEMAALAAAPQGAEEEPEAAAPLKLHAVLATWLARRSLGLPGLAALPRAQAAPALAALQKGLAGPLQKELAHSLRGLTDPGQAALAGEMLRAALALIAQELAGLDPDRVDPQYIDALIVAP